VIELTPLARPYAKALFAAANESNNLDTMADELKTMAIASQEEGVIKTIENPVLSRKEIVDILMNLFDESVSETSKKLLSILVENKRLNLLQPIYDIYKDLLEKHKKQNQLKFLLLSSLAVRQKII
jgi:F-type H+-transporting ATPase subunit delta